METATDIKPRLRPAWRIPLTIVAMFGFVAMGIGVSLGVVSFAPIPVARFASLAAMSAAAIGIAYLLRRHIDRRDWRAVGLTWRPVDLSRLLIGGALAAAVVVTAHGVNILLGLSRWHPSFDEKLPLIPALLLTYLVILLGQAFPEELLWRGYLFASLSAEWRRYAVIIATSAGFGVMHVISNPGADAALGWRLLYAVMACGLGFALGACRAWGGSIWLAVGFHAGHNFTGGILGTGAYDLSLLVSFAVFVGFGLLMLRLAPRSADAPAAARHRPAARCGRP